MASANEKLDSNSVSNGGLTDINKQCSTEIDYNQTNGHLETNTEDISCEFFINNINNNNNTNTYDHDDSDNECLSGSKIDTSYVVAVADNNKKRVSSISNNVCDGLPAVSEQKNTAVTTEKRLRGRRGSVVLELNCTTQSFGEKGTCIENYTSKLTTDDGNNSDNSLEDSELVTNRKFEECATKSHRTWKEGDEVLTESEIKFREDEKIIETKEGKKVSEYSFRTDENHVSTTYSFEILGDKVLRTAKTNRRSSTNSSMKMEKDSSDTSIKSSEKDIMSLPSSDTKVTKSTEDDKFAVSFNSDTSEDEDSDSEESVTSKSVSDGTNDVTSGEATNNVLCNGFKDKTEEIRIDKVKDSGHFKETNSPSNEKVKVKDLFNEFHYDNSENFNVTESSDTESLSKQNISTCETHESEISGANKTSAHDVISIKHDKNEKEQDGASDKELNLSVGHLENKNIDDVASGPSFSFTVDCSESRSAHKKTFTVCKAEEATSEIPEDKDTVERKECTLLNNMADKTSALADSSHVKSTLTSSTCEEPNLSKHLDENIMIASKAITDLQGDIVKREVIAPNKTLSGEQNKHMDISNNIEQHIQSNGDATFSSQQEFYRSKTTANKASNLETEVAQLPAALINLGTFGETTVNTGLATETGNLIDISSDVSNSKNNAKLLFDEQETILTKTKEKMAEPSLNSDVETNGGFKLSEKLITHEITDKHENKFINDLDSLSSTKATDKKSNVDERKYFDTFHMEKGFDDETMDFSTGAKRKKEFKLFDDGDTFDGDSYSDLKVMDEKDGSKTYEKTTTFIAGDRHSTDDLIKRILAEARGEIAATNHRENYRINMGDNDDRSYLEERATERSRREVIDDRESPANNVPDYRQRHRDSSDREKEPSLLDRRLASMGFTSDHKTSSSQGQGYEDYEETQYSSATPRGHDRQTQPSGGGSSLFDGIDSYGETDSDRGSFKRRQFRSGLMRKQQAVFHDDWDQDEEDDDEDEHDPYLRRQPAEEYIPDEEFVPKKAEDTDRVVKERTQEIRKVVDNQNNVLQRLKSASDSFDEVSNEIKEIKQQFLDSQMRRSIILDEIDHERMLIDQMDHERQQEAQGLPAYSSIGRQQRVSRQREDDNYEFESKYRPTKPITSRTVELDKELEDDRLGRGTLSSLAIGGSGKTSYSSYATGAGSNYLDNYKSKYLDDMDIDNKYGASSSISARSGYGTGYTSRGRRGRSQSMFEDTDMDYDAGDYGISSSSKSHSRFSSKYGNSYQADRAQNGDDDDTASETSSYKSPNLPSYRKYDYDSEQKSSGASSYSSPYKSRYGTGSSRSASTSRLSGLSRSKTMDYNFESPSSSSYDKPSYGASKYSSSSSTSSGFSSKFLDKVRQKKASGEEIKRDKPFSSRFLGKSVDLTSTPSFSRPSFGKDDSRSNDPSAET